MEHQVKVVAPEWMSNSPAAQRIRVNQAGGTPAVEANIAAVVMEVESAQARQKDRFRLALVAALRTRIDSAGCTQRQGVDIRNCAACWPLRPNRWCLACLLTAVVEGAADA